MIPPFFMDGLDALKKNIPYLKHKKEKKVEYELPEKANNPSE
jgi:hypothetical protein